MPYDALVELKKWIDQRAVGLVEAHTRFSGPGFDSELVVCLLQDFGEKVAAEVSGSFNIEVHAKGRENKKLREDKRQLRAEIDRIKAQMEARRDAVVTVPDTAGRVFKEE